MKTSKRILSLLLVMVFVLTATFTTPVFAAFSDVAETDAFSGAVSNLSTLGIINGYEDGTFRPLNNVTRAEFTALILRAIGYGDIGSTELTDPPYPDVVTSDVSWAIGNIRTAKAMGIVTGYEDGTFRPMNNVLYEEAITMIVRAIGYENYTPDGGEWYTKYLTTAGSIGILKNVNGTISVPATRAIIALLINNVLESDATKNNTVAGSVITGNSMAGGSVMENMLGYIQKTGIIMSNRVTSLESPDVNLRDNEIMIKDLDSGETSKYITNDVAKYDAMIGYRVDFSYKENKETGYNELKSVNPKKYNYLDISAKDIEDAKCDGNAIVYYEGGVKQKKINIDPKSVVIYNGKLYGATAAESGYADYFAGKGLPVVGSLKLLDNNNDNKYDVVFVEQYEIYVVSSITRGTYTIYDKVIRNNESIVLDEENDDFIKFVDTKGYDSSFSSISAGSVLSIKKSNEENGSDVLTTVVINNVNPTGNVTGTKSGRSVTIGTKTYNYSDAAPWMNGSDLLAEPKLEDSAKFYLDLNEEVVGYEKSQAQVNQKYGYISSYAEVTSGMDDVLKVTMFVPGTAGLSNYVTNSKTKINGLPDQTPDQMIDILNAAASYQGKYSAAEDNECSQLIKFTATGNVLNEIITAKQSDPVETLKPDELIISKSYSPEEKTAKTTSSRVQLISNVEDEKSIISVLTAATLISVPNKRKEKKYSTISTSQLDINTNYRVDVYDIKGSEPKVVVFYDMGAAVNEVKANTIPFIITELVDIGDNKYNVYGYNGKSETTLSKPLVSSPDSFDAFKTLFDDNGGKGYVVRFGKDAEGNVTLDEKNVIFSNDSSLRETVMANHETEDGNGGWKKANGEGCHIKGSIPSGTSYGMIWGYVHSVGDTYVQILDDLDENAFHIYSSYKDALVLKYEESGTGFNIKKLEDDVATALQTEATKFGNENPTEVFVYGTNDTTISIVIIKE